MKRPLLILLALTYTQAHSQPLPMLAGVEVIYWDRNGQQQEGFEPFKPFNKNSLQQQYLLHYIVTEFNKTNQAVTLAPQYCKFLTPETLDFLIQHNYLVNN